MKFTGGDLVWTIMNYSGVYRTIRVKLYGRPGYPIFKFYRGGQTHSVRRSNLFPTKLVAEKHLAEHYRWALTNTERRIKKMEQAK